ncbi:MAG TPA: CDP-alcohol phosphatidyltransferase family protein [Mycobacteriales bacterium]|jgi:phosphatidylglycerophosphate synthase|nr:CDP-alcohol phosphatidyltransferase family protein [Mycobacteriales bacterium]
MSAEGGGPGGGRRPSLAELRTVAQPDSVVGRVSGEHWAGRLYQRKVSIHLTRLLAPTRVTPDGITWTMLLTGPLAGLAMTVPHLWGPLVAFALIQVQGTLDCVDGELARWRDQRGARGVYLDRIGHYVTDGCLAVGVGVHADGGLGSMAGWTTIGLAVGFLVLLTKAETDLVHVARAQSGRPPIADTSDVARPRGGLLRRLRRLAAAVPFNRALLALEMTVLALVAAAVDAGRGGLDATQVLSVVLLAIAGLVVAGHLLATLASDRVR